MIKKRLIYLFSFLLVYTLSFPQNVRHLSVKNGLPQSFVSGISEDEEGFIWISTHNGLARYDGNNFEIFQNKPGDNSSISSNFISNSIKGKNGDLWLRFDSGAIDVFNMTTHKVNHIISRDFLDQNKIIIARRGWLISQDDFFWYISQNGKVCKFNLPAIEETTTKAIVDEYSFSTDEIYSIIEDSKSNIWVLSKNAINKFDTASNEFIKYNTPYPFDADYKFDFGEEIPSILEKENGDLMWIGKKSLYIFTPEKIEFKQIKLPEEVTFNGKLLAKADTDKEYLQLNRTLYSYTEKAGFTKKVVINNSRETQSLLVDKSGLIWLGANTDGIYLVDLKTDFKAFKYKEDFAVDLIEKELKISFYNFFDINSSKRGDLPPAYYLRSVRDSEKNKIWIAVNRTVSFFYTFENKLYKLPSLPDTSPTVSNEIAGITLSKNKTPIVIDKKNTIYRYEEEASSWEIIFSGSQLKSVIGYRVSPSNIYADDNNLWITTEYDGLINVNLITNIVTRISGDTEKYKIPSQKLYGSIPDEKEKNILWIASSHGLIRFSKDTYESTLFSVEDGLPDNVIYSILLDESGYIWMGTNKGICRFNPETRQTRTFTERHGLPCFEFNRYHQLYLPNGKVAFGGVESGVLFDPLKIKEDNFNPNIAITGIKINNLSFNTETETPFNTITSIALPYNQNTLAIEYAALEFSQPQDIIYRYRLKGYDNNWVVAGNKKEAVYTKIPPGNYIFETNATNTTGKWSTIVKSLAIKISPPWWATWWAFGIYIFLALFITIVFIKYSIKQGLIKNEILLKQKETEQLKEMDEVKSRFFSNITHELRTPLTLIMGPAEQLKKVKEEQQQKHLLSIITKNANNLLNLTNQLLDIAKLEAGALKPHMRWGDIISEIKQVISLFSEEAAIKNNSIRFEGPQKAEYFFAPEIVERILYNLLSNALKYSNNKDTITVKLTEEHEGITLQVEDRGKGIPENELKNIFKRFYHIESDKKEVGTGIGLSLVKELVELQGGAINVNSSIQKENHGTTFNIFLPYNKISNQTTVNDPENTKIKEKINLTETANNKPTILLVEDNYELASFIATSLKPYYNIYHAENGKIGINMALKIIPDLILSDVLMDEMDGFEMCKFLKEDINTDHIPIILLTAKSDTESKLEGLSYKADDYITKPFNISELLMRIENRLELQKKQRNYIYRKFKVLPDDEKTEEKQNVVEDVFLQKVYNVIEKRLDDENLNVEELAAELNMSRTSLHRKVKTLTNMSTGEIIKVYRLKKAVLLLKENYNISEVAYKTGFGSPSYFSKCFKEVYAVTPTEYSQKNIN
ncbi:hybrid sensor histidine kinase/response regulator [Flavobacterium suaedae]|uniref:histidine kinase n=1 Tax=Flavobacterium suaedae TaxID=1767027 RepID=A0ABQ1JH73_9FLAO|nr:ATP-binding protein [Flavobacterium suaedae]GGB68929.1 hybrid sensor histidine kinase/response regulator [Flavobacterium suaedae]